MAIFGPKPWVKPLGKMSIFGLFELLVFIAQKGVFSIQNILKDIFLAYIALKKELEKQPFLEQNHGLTPLENCQFLDFLTSCFYSLERCFSFQNIVKDIFLPYIALKKNVGKIAIFRPKPWVNPFGKMSIFGLLNFLFLQRRKAFFCSRIS